MFFICIFRSGTDEEYTERQEILQEVVDLYNDRERIARINKAPPAPATDIRKRAMQILKGKIKTIVTRKTRIGVFACGQILCISPNGLQASHGIN